MSLFGWGYPPGVSNIPGDEPFVCEVCGQSDDNCICPECPVCGEIGWPECYRKHGLEFSRYQRICLEYTEFKEIQYIRDMDKLYKEEINTTTEY